jgi:hypothetical protein
LAGAGQDLVDRSGRQVAQFLYVLVAKAALDAQMARSDVVVLWGGDLDDPVVLNVEIEVAADPAI